MTRLQRLGDLDVAQNLAFTRREWLLRRIAWALVALTLLVALSGLFGGGPLSRGTGGRSRLPAGS
jgi:hypothetical protein